MRRLVASMVIGPVMSLFALLLAGCAGVGDYCQLVERHGGPRPGTKKVFNGYFAPLLFDPYSAVYEFGTVSPGWVRGSSTGGFKIEGRRVCGTVNAKNRYGGYVVARPFIAVLQNGQVVKVLQGDHAIYAVSGGACREASALATTPSSPRQVCEAAFSCAMAGEKFPPEVHERCLRAGVVIPQ